MVQSGQAAKAIKKKTDAMPKTGAKKLLKDAALTAVMFTPPGRVVKGIGLAAKAAGVAKDVKVAKAIKNVSAIEKRMAAVDKADTKKVTREVRKVINRAEESGKYKKTPVKTKTNRDNDSFESAAERGERIPRKKLTQTKPERKPVSDKDASEVSKEMTQRPNNSGRVRQVKRPSSKELSPREKAADIASKKSPVTVVKKKPMSSAEIAKARATARKAKFDKVLTPRPKPKPNRAPLKPIDRSRGSNAPVKPKLSDEAQILENAKNNPRNWEIADQRPKATIDKGRGDTQQPPSITKNPIKRNREERIEARKARRANVRDKRTDIREASTPGFEKLQSVRRGVPRNAAERAEGRANAEARARLAAKAKKGSKMSRRSTTNDPRNAASDAGNMRERLKAIDKLTAARAKKRSNKVSPELMAKVNVTLGSSKTAKKSRQLQNTFNQPKFSRNVKTGRLRATRPIKPVKKK
jgi:hypothetical protein